MSSKELLAKLGSAAVKWTATKGGEISTGLLRSRHRLGSASHAGPVALLLLTPAQRPSLALRARCIEV